MRIIATIKIDIKADELQDDATEQDQKDFIATAVCNGFLEYKDIKEVIIAG